MTPHTLNKILQSGPVHFDRPSAVMKVAWIRLAQKYWSERRFDVPVPKLRRDLGDELRQAWIDVRKVRELRARRAKAEKDRGAELACLRQQRRDLQHKPLAVSIGQAQQEIDRKIAAIYEAA